MAADQKQDYFIAGLHDEMIAQLGRLHPSRLGVIARTSALQYATARKPVDQIGRELRVEYVLDRRRHGPFGGLVHRHTVLGTADAADTARALRAMGTIFVSSGMVTDSHAQLGFSKAFLVRDPDGHALAIIER